MKFNLEYIGLDYIENLVLLKDYAIQKDEDKPLFISIYADDLLRLFQEKLDYQMKEIKDYVFINEYEVVTLLYLKGMSPNKQKEFLPIKESVLEEAEYEYYTKFKNIDDEEEKAVEEEIYKRNLIRNYDELGEVMFSYIKNKYTLYFECFKD